MRKTWIATTGLANEHSAFNGSLRSKHAHIDRIGRVYPAHQGEHVIGANRRWLQFSR